VTAALLVATWAVPLAMLAACLSPRVRARMPEWLWCGSLPGLAAALLAHDAAPLVADAEGLRITLALDPAGAILLGVSSLLWTAAGVYARRHLRGDPKAARFAEWWLPTLAGSLGVFVAADLFSFYIAFALALAAWGLVVHDETPRARRAGALYLGLAVLGEICLLLAFALVAAEAPGDTLAIRDVAPVLATAPSRHLAIALLLAGFGLKAGLVPLHVWLPLAHPAAPTPASAVLSGAIVKAGVIGLLRFLPFDPALSEWGVALAFVGLLTAFYGVVVGITQRNPKTVLAYSTVSQMGGVAAILGMGLANGDASAVAAASFTAAHHVLVKGACFFAVGVAAVTGGRRWIVTLPATLLALALAGFPGTGGAIAKLAAKTPMGDGTAASLATFAAAGTTLLMLHFVMRLREIDASGSRPIAAGGFVAPWIATAFAAAIVPWSLAGPILGATPREVFAPYALGSAAWPILLGGGLLFVLRRYDRALPSLPEGDIVVLGAPAGRVARAGADALERADARLSEWPAAGVSLLAVTILLGLAMLAGP
jgi:formate hydrogenlyase subunit 3/multisubunit Na+/H+ antiporter MnhD subunit